MNLGPYFANMAAGLEERLSGDDPGPRAHKHLALAAARLGERLFAGEAPVAWCGVSAPFDLLHALGVTSCFIEFIGGALASAGAARPQLEAAEEAGYSTDICAYHRTVLGAARNGLIPEPAFLVATSCPCAAGQSTVALLAHHFDRPLFVLDVPRRADASSEAYLAAQLEDLVRFASAHTGTPDNARAIREAVELTNEARDLAVELYTLARRVPSPARPRELRNFNFIFSLLLGSPAAVDLTRAYRDEYLDRIKHDDPGVPGERVRLLWFQNRIQFKQPLDALLTELGATVVVDELNDITWEPLDPDDPYLGMARRILSIPLNTAIENRLAHLVEQVRQYRVDGVIFPGHWGCRQGTGASGLITRGLGEAGIPVLNLGVDCVDERSFSEAQLRTRLQAFVEMLSERPGSC